MRTEVDDEYPFSWWNVWPTICDILFSAFAIPRGSNF